MATTFTDSQKNDMEYMCPIAKNLDLHDRWQWLTTAGWDDGTCTLESGTITSATLTDSTITNADSVDIHSLAVTALTSANAVNTSTVAGSITEGLYVIGTGYATGVYKITSSPTSGDLVKIINKNTGNSTVYVVTSSGTSPYIIGPNAATFSGYRMSAGDYVELFAVSTAIWYHLGSTASVGSYAQGTST